MRILWINEAADFVGGCEQYIYNTVRLLGGMNPGFFAATAVEAEAAEVLAAPR